MSYARWNYLEKAQGHPITQKDFLRETIGYVLEEFNDRQDTTK